MDVFFRSRKLEKSCSSERAMLQMYGAARSRKLRTRLMELRAADHLAQIPKVPPPRCHELAHDRKGQLSVDLDHPYRLVFIPANEPIPRREDGGLDWAGVTQIEILEIVDTH